MKTSKPSSLAKSSVNLGAAMGEFEGVQLVVKPSSAIRSVEIVASDLSDSKGHTISSNEISIYKVAYVHISKPSSFLPGRAGDYPDPLPPYVRTEMSPGICQPVYVLFHVSNDSAPGQYTGAISISAEGEETKSIPVNFTVFPFSIGNHFECRMGFSSPDLIAQAENMYLYDGEGRGKAVISRYIKSLTDHKISPFGCWPAQGSPKSDGSWDFYSSFSPNFPGETPDKYFHLYLAEYASRGYRLPIYFSGGKWLPGAPVTSLAANRLKSVARYMRQNNFYGKLFAYPIDEPAENAASTKRILAFIKWMLSITKSLGYPKIPFLLTEEPIPGVSALFSYVDIWVPVVHRYYYNIPSINKVRARGKKIWWYTNAGQAQGYSPTFLIDDYAVEPRIISWLAYKERVRGLLYFNTARWLNSRKVYQDPWKNPLSLILKIKKRNVYANGEGVLLYPGYDAGYAGYDALPIGSLRLERIRDGVEDYEYLYTLEALGEKAYIDSIFGRTLAPFGYGQYKPGQYKNFPNVSYASSIFGGVRDHITHMITAKKSGLSPATAKGRVTYERRPVMNAIVSDGIIGTRTNKYGNYTLRGVLPGTINITVKHPQYFNKTLSVKTNDGRVSRLNFKTAGKKTRLLYSFERSTEGWWSITRVKLYRSGQVATYGGHFPTLGSRSLKAKFPRASNPYMSVRNRFRRWSGYRSLEFDVYSPSTPNFNRPWLLSVSLVDGSWHRSKYYFLLPKGYFHVKCSFSAGTRGRGFTFKNVARVLVGLNNAGARTIYFDNFRLIK